jgi:hypothetical protein
MLQPSLYSSANSAAALTQVPPNHSHRLPSALLLSHPALFDPQMACQLAACPRPPGDSCLLQLLLRVGCQARSTTSPALQGPSATCQPWLHSESLVGRRDGEAGIRSSNAEVKKMQ